jgi:hypothetical protein
MKGQREIARALHWQRSNEQRSAGRIVRSKTWGGKQTPKQVRQEWRQKGEH